MPIWAESADFYVKRRFHMFVCAGCRSYAKGIGTAFEKRQDLRVIICNALATLCLQNRKALKVHLQLVLDLAGC